MTVKISLWMLLAGFLALATTSCDVIEEITEEVIDDEASALQEDDLPNCSRAINCCTALESGTISAAIPDSVSEMCNTTVSVAADSAITEYQRELAAIDAQSGISDEQRASLTSDLVDEWQGRVEPGCKCFMTDTVGTLPDLALPQDCEPITSTGDLEGETCSEALEALTTVSTD